MTRMARVTTKIDRQAVTASRPIRYRVEHHEEDVSAVLGVVTGIFEHHRSLDPFVTELLRRGSGGHLLLIDEATGMTVARRAVRPFGARARNPFRTSGD